MRIVIPRRPDALTQCDCSICRRYGTLWAYYREGEVAITAGESGLVAYAWGNARLFEPPDLGPVRIRRLDGAGTEEYLPDPEPDT